MELVNFKFYTPYKEKDSMGQMWHLFFVPHKHDGKYNVEYIRFATGEERLQRLKDIYPQEDIDNLMKVKSEKTKRKWIEIIFDNGIPPVR